MSIHQLRQGIPDSTLLDWLELCEECPDGRFTVAWLRGYWQLSQPAACRRLQRLHAAGLVEHEGRRGHADVWQLRVDRLPVALPGGPSLGQPLRSNGLGRMDVPTAERCRAVRPGAAAP